MTGKEPAIFIITLQAGPLSHQDAGSLNEANKHNDLNVEANEDDEPKSYYAIAKHGVCIKRGWVAHL